MPSTKKAPAWSHTPRPKPNERNFCIPVETIVPQSAPQSTSKRSQRWKALERTAARKLRGKRIVREFLFEVAPDVIVEDFGLIVEAKAYRRFSHHTLLETSQRKYCHDGEVAVLVTKHEGQHGEYATVSLDWLAGIMDEVRRARKAAP